MRPYCRTFPVSFKDCGSHFGPMEVHWVLIEHRFCGLRSASQSGQYLWIVVEEGRHNFVNGLEKAVAGGHEFWKWAANGQLEGCVDELVDENPLAFELLLVEDREDINLSGQ